MYVYFLVLNFVFNILKDRISLFQLNLTYFSVTCQTFLPEHFINVDTNYKDVLVPKRIPIPFYYLV